MIMKDFIIGPLIKLVLKFAYTLIDTWNLFIDFFVRLKHNYHNQKNFLCIMINESLKENRGFYCPCLCT